MKLKENTEKINRIITAHGKEHQSMVAIEEMAELIKELSKTYRGKFNKEHLTEELADVLLMAEQVRLMFNIDEEELKRIIQIKIERTLHE